MPDFYVLPAHVIENLEVVAAVSEKNAAKKFAERGGITAGRVVVIPADQVTSRTIESITTVDAT
jgi:hypothetical protein